MANLLTEKTVVICEDEGNTLMFLQRILTRAGMKVVACATDGLEGVQQVLRERPDIVMMDLKLPAIEGTEAIRRILATYASYQPCIIVVTAYGDVEHRRTSSEAGAHGFVEKPFNAKVILAEIRRVLESRDCGLSDPDSADS